MTNAIVNYNEEWAKQAGAYTSQEQLTGGTFLSTRGGTLQLGEEVLPGNQACVVILDAVKENTFYAGDFDPDNKAAPVCYSFGRGAESEDEMAPHESMQVDLSYFKPQAESCHGCKWNEWGTADKGKGKRCKNIRRLTLLPAGFYQAKRGSRDFDLEIFDDPKHFQTAETVGLKVSVTSVKHWAKFVNDVSTTFRRPPHGVIARISLEPDPKSQYKICFEVIEEVPDALAAIIMQRHDAAVKSVIQGYRPPEEKQAGTETHRGSLRGLRSPGRR